MELQPLDWAIIGGFILLTVSIGVIFSRRAGKSISEYFVSGRKLPWWIAGTSMVATTFAADTPLAVTGIVIKDGLAGNWVWWAFAFGGMITVFVYAKLWRRSEVMTDVELIDLRYSGRPAKLLRIVRSCYVALLINAIVIGWVCNAMLTFFDATILHEVENAKVWRWVCLLGSLVVVGVYCTLSGMWGVTATDVVQFVFAMFGCVALAVIALNVVGGPSELQAKVIEAKGAGALDFIPRLSWSGEGVLMPFYAFAIVVCVQWWATWYPGAEPGGGGYVVQRMASCRSEKDSLLATLWFQFAHYCLRPWPWIIVAFAALVLYPELSAENSDLKADMGFPMVIRDHAPTGIVGLMLATFFAAFMSTISTQMNWGASYIVRDIYQPFLKKDASEQELTLVSRVASVMILALGIIATIFLQRYDIDKIWKILLALGAGTGAIFMLRWFWWRISAWTEISAMLFSLLFFLMIGVKEKDLWTQVIVVERDEIRILLVAICSIVSCLVVTYLTPATDPKKLKSFFEKVRPYKAGWGPIARQLKHVKTDQDLWKNVFLAVLASAIVYATIPGIGALIFGQYVTAGICLGIAIAGLCVLLKMMKSLNLFE